MTQSVLHPVVSATALRGSPQATSVLTPAKPRKSRSARMVSTGQRAIGASGLKKRHSGVDSALPTIGRD